MSNDKKIPGSIIIYSVSGIPKAGIPYEDFDSIFEACADNPDAPGQDFGGFDRDCMPTMNSSEVQHALSAWELGTGDFPTKGALFNPGQAVIDHYTTDDVQPIFRVRVVRHRKGNDGDVIKRHLYMDVLRATAESDLAIDAPDLRDVDEHSKQLATEAAMEQLVSMPIILMEFASQIVGEDEKGRPVYGAAMRFAPTSNVDRKILPAIQQLTDTMKAKVKQAKGSANDQKIRTGVRKWLKRHACFSVRGGSGAGATYFIPEFDAPVDENGVKTGPSSADLLNGLACYFDQLADLCPAGTGPDLMIVDAVSSRGKLFSRRSNDNMIEKAQEAINDRLDKAIKDMAPIIEGKMREQDITRRMATVEAEISMTYRALDQYRAAFDDKFDKLESLIELVEDRLAEARKAA